MINAINLGYSEILFLLAFLSVPVVLFWKIIGRMGFSPALGLLIIVPFVNLALLGYLAFAQWPAVQRQTQQVGSGRSA